MLTVSINWKGLLTKELRIVVKPLSFEATCVERSLGIMGYLSSLPYLAKWRLFCRSRLQCMRVFNESIQISQFRPPPYTFINLHTPPLTLNYPYSDLFTFTLLYLRSYTFTNRHPPSDAHIDYVRLLFLKSSAQGTEFMLCRNLTSRTLDKESAV